MKIHITGGKGFIGRRAADSIAQSHDVEVSDLDSLDVTDAAAVASRFTSCRPDVVVHLAGVTDAAASARDPLKFFTVNTVGSLNVLEGCRLAGVGRIVLMSSLTVHGESTNGRVDETSPMRPRHPYGASKAASEMSAIGYCRRFGMSCVALRPTQLVGEGQPHPNAVTEFIESAIAGENIELYGGGEHQREWLDVSDFTPALAAAVEYVTRLPQGNMEPFIISSEEPISMRNLAEKIVRLIGNGRPVPIAKPTSQAFSLLADCSKAAAALGWRPQKSLDRLLSETVKSWSSRSMPG